MKCPLCGHEFEVKEEITSCSGCPFFQGCNLLCCPRCGYRWPPSNLPDKIKKRRKKNE